MSDSKELTTKKEAIINECINSRYHNSGGRDTSCWPYDAADKYALKIISDSKDDTISESEFSDLYLSSL